MVDVVPLGLEVDVPPVRQDGQDILRFERLMFEMSGSGCGVDLNWWMIRLSEM